MMRGYLTVFLSLSLSILTGFILLLTGGAIRNGAKVRMEYGLDAAMNSTLAEYHRGLLEKYDLLYIDTSYLAQEPSKENLERRLQYYLEENIDPPWGNVTLKTVEITEIETAAADMGASVRSQAVTYMQDRDRKNIRQWAVMIYIDELRSLEGGDPLGEWSSLMEQIAGMELPKVQNEEGIWEEVPLANPADVVYGLFGSDIFYLAEVDLSAVSNMVVPTETYISHRQVENTEARNRQFEKSDEIFLSYLFEKLGYLHEPAADSLLSCQLEYVACAGNSDWENVRAVGNRLFRWRFADNLSCALSDGNLRNQAALLADALTVVQMNAAFREPVIQSILYACAYLESVNDIRLLYDGGSVPVRKGKLHISAEYILTGNLYRRNDSSGLSYEEYLAGMLLLQGEEALNLRVMDVMEMEMRIRDHNHYFAMNWCVERYQVQISARNHFGNTWHLKRKYGYF